MSRTVGTILYILYLAGLGLGYYEFAAKFPARLGADLPGGVAARRAERIVRWNPSTGIMALDRLLHEGHEAWVFYGGAYRPGPDRALRSSRSFSNAR